METISDLLKVLTNATSNPILFIVIVLVLFFTTGFFTLFFNRIKNIIRKKETDTNRERDRQRDLDELEADHSGAVQSARDRIRKKQNEKES
jgi:hypothetical protein